jgi:hypothetical protein
MRRFCAFLAFVTLAAQACGGGDDDGGYTVDGDKLTFHTGSFEVGPGDVFECFYTGVITDQELAVNSVFAKQHAGGHHVTIYYTTIQQDPNHHPCMDSEMANWRMIGGAAGSSEATVLTLPENFAARVPAGVQLVIQAHYINTGENFTTDDEIGLNLIDPANVESYVNQFLVNDDTFDIPAHETLERVQTCTVPQDLQIVRLLGHMHEWGSHYSLEQLDDAGNPVSMLIDDEWDPVYASHPPVNEYEPAAPLLLAAGTRLRQTCDWSNDTDQDILFPREMCIGFGLYFPDAGEVYCEPDAQ